MGAVADYYYGNELYCFFIKRTKALDMVMSYIALAVICQ